MVNSFFPANMRLNLPLFLMLLLCLPASPTYGDQLEIVVQGVEEPILGNVVARTQSFRITGNTRISRKQREKMQADAERRASSALRPYGYYQAAVRGEMKSAGDGNWVLTLEIDKGPPVIIKDARVDLVGPGKSDAGLLNWQATWPLTPGLVLDQDTWEKQKAEALGLAEVHGYLEAGFSEQVIRLDLDNNTAELVLVLETGEQSVMGSIVYNQDEVDDAVLNSLPRFSEGQPYDQWLIEQFRLDLWKTGYFNNIEVIEERRLEEIPPRVNLVVNMEARNRNTYQGSIGLGSDTGVRLQAIWNQHLLSSRGDSLDVGVGWQQQNNQISLRTAYRQPRKVPGQQYWTAELLYKTEIQEFEVSPNEDPNRFITIARGRVDDYSFKPGWLRVRSLERGYQQIFEQWYLQYLKETTSFSLVEDIPSEYFALLGHGSKADNVNRPSESLSVGVNWNWPLIRGNDFETVGYNHRAWIFTSNTAWGSDLDFSQAYLSSRWNKIFKERWKILLRGEIGYSDAKVYNRTVGTGEDTISISVTELPYAYRFKAGGSQSVRGYGYDSLSNNNIGSNNIITASAELEMRFLPKWSAAVFVDVGNAFNEWSSMELKKGAGVGIRWYSIAGAVRVDLAQALDEPDKPWTVHFTIGTPLL
jgi:translocation and assembly module TamA